MSPHEEVALRVKEQLFAGNIRLMAVDWRCDFARSLYMVSVRIKLRGYHPETDTFEHEVYLGPMTENNTTARAIADEWRDLMAVTPLSRKV